MKRISLFFLLFLLPLAVLFAQSTEAVKVEDNPNAPEITFENTVHDYGTLVYGGDGTCYFKFTNTGKEPLIIQKPQSSCGCTVPSWPKEPILPGEGDQIKVTYNTKRVGAINKTVTVRSNAKNSTVVLRIKGKVERKPVQTMPEKEASEGAPVNK
jgi:hypothetical protein